MNLQNHSVHQMISVTIKYKNLQNHSLHKMISLTIKYKIRMYESSEMLHDSIINEHHRIEFVVYV